MINFNSALLSSLSIWCVRSAFVPQDAFVESLTGSRLVKAMVSEDVGTEMLQSLPGAAALFQTYPFTREALGEHEPLRSS